MKRTKTRQPRKRTKTKTTNGSRLLFLLLVGLVLTPAFAAKKKAPETFAIIAGTTFRPPGFALPGSKVRIEPGSPRSGDIKLKAVESVTDSRGEFAVRVPPVPVEWTVRVQANGYQPQSRKVSISGEERVDLSFVLEPGEAQTKRGEGK
jgi:hypothetical protein